MVSNLLKASIAASFTVTGYAILQHLIGDDQSQGGDGSLSAPKEVYGCRYIRLPSAVVGLIIGNKGSNINRLQEESGCLLRVVTKEPSSVEDLLVEDLNGSFKETDQGSAEEEGRVPVPYLEVVAQKDTKLDYLLMLLADTIKRSEESLGEEILLVSRKHIGFVIGKRGVNIRRICTDTGTSITIDDDLKDESAPDCSSEKGRIRIYGPVSQVRVAADMIEDSIWHCIGVKGKQVNSQRENAKLERSLEEQLNEIRAIEQACEKMVTHDENWE